jgi:hypothetical protein
MYFYKRKRNRLSRPGSLPMTQTLTAFEGGTCLTWILTVAASAAASLLRPGLAELGVSAALDPKAPCHYQDRP